jgi:chromosome segregation ATPase
VAKTATAKPSADRTRLREAITARHSEEQRLAALEEAQDRVHRQLWQAQSRLQNEEATLRRVTHDEGQRKVYAYLNNDAPDADPVADATAMVDTAQDEVARLAELETGLVNEISRVQANLRQLHTDQYAALAEIIVGSPEYAALLEAHKAAWMRLRTVKKALQEVVTGCHAQLPQRFADEPLRAEPLESDRVGFPVDAEFVGSWTAALGELANDADAELPQV